MTEREIVQLIEQSNAKTASALRQLRDERDAAMRLHDKDVFALKCDNEALTLQLKIRMDALTAAEAEAEAERERCDELEEENGKLGHELDGYKNGESLAEMEAMQEACDKQHAKLVDALSASGRGMERLRAKFTAARKVVGAVRAVLSSYPHWNHEDYHFPGMPELAKAFAALPKGVAPE